MGDYNVDRSIRRYASFLKKAYMWPKDGEKITLRLSVKCFVRILALSMNLYVGSSLYLYKSRQGDPNNELLDVFWNLLELCAVFISSFTLCFIKGNKFIAFLKHLTNHSLGKPENIEQIDKRQEKFIVFIYYLFKVICLAHILNNYFQNKYCDVRSLRKDDRYVCGLLSPFWFPINLNFFPAKELLILNSIFTLWIFLPAMTINIYMVFYCVELLTVRIGFLKRRIQKLNFNKETSSEEFKRKFLWCIKYHSQILELVKEMHESLGYYFVAQYTIYSTLLASLVYKVTEEISVWNISHFMIWFLLETVVCFSGQYLENEAESLTCCIHDIEWLDMPSELRSNYKLFQSKSLMPLQMKAQPILVMNNEFLMMVLKAAFSFSMYLRRFSQE